MLGGTGAWGRPRVCPPGSVPTGKGLGRRFRGVHRDRPPSADVPHRPAPARALALPRWAPASRPSSSPLTSGPPLSTALPAASPPHAVPPGPQCSRTSLPTPRPQENLQPPGAPGSPKADGDRGSCDAWMRLWGGLPPWGWVWGAAGGSSGPGAGPFLRPASRPCPRAVAGGDWLVAGAACNNPNALPPSYRILHCTVQLLYSTGLRMQLLLPICTAPCSPCARFLSHQQVFSGRHLKAALAKRSSYTESLYCTMSAFSAPIFLVCYCLLVFMYCTVMRAELRGRGLIWPGLHWEILRFYIHCHCLEDLQDLSLSCESTPIMYCIKFQQKEIRFSNTTHKQVYIQKCHNSCQVAKCRGTCDLAPTHITQTRHQKTTGNRQMQAHTPEQGHTSTRVTSTEQRAVPASQSRHTSTPQLHRKPADQKHTPHRPVGEGRTAESQGHQAAQAQAGRGATPRRLGRTLGRHGTQGRTTGHGAAHCTSRDSTAQAQSSARVPPIRPRPA